MSAAGRTPVVLYVCTTIRGDAARVLAELRQYSVAQGWSVVEEFVDRTGAAPEASRPGFLKAKAEIEAGRAKGLVTRYPAMAAYQPQEREVLTAWLEQHSAWACYTWKPTPVVTS